MIQMMRSLHSNLNLTNNCFYIFKISTIQSICENIVTQEKHDINALFIFKMKYLELTIYICFFDKAQEIISFQVILDILNGHCILYTQENI
jgi:hypothetical protein